MKETLGETEARLFDAADGYRFAVARSEEGVVHALGDGVARVRGLSQARLDERVTIAGADGVVQALVMDLAEDDVGVVLLGPRDSVQVGARVRPSGELVSVPVGDALLGRVVDALGQPLDGDSALDAVGRDPVEQPAPGVLARDLVREQLHTGLTVVDALFPIGRGQRQLIVGDLGTGKSTVAIDTVINQARHGVRCVYVVVGQKNSFLVTLVETLRRRGVLGNTSVVAAAADAPAGMRYLAPYAGCTIAEHFRDRGEDALVVYDDLSRHAIAYRELSLLLRRPPGREAYPGDIFFVHSRLLERATQLDKEHGGGSLTALPVVETQAGRISDFIPTNLISITDGQLYLDRLKFDRGVKPAIDIGLSVSRVGGKAQRSSLKAVASRLRLDLARFQEVEVFSRFGTRLEEGTRRLLQHGARARELLKQSPSSARPLADQVVSLLALEAGYFDDLPLAAVVPVADRYRQLVHDRLPELVRDLALGRPASDAQTAELEEVFAEARRAHEEGGR